MKENLEVLALIVAIATPVVGGLWFVWKKSQSAIQNNYQTLAQTWTNEGSINSTEEMFMELSLTLNNGELYGLLSSPQLERDYGVYVYTGWFSSKLEISESLGRGVLLKAIIKVRITGNRNRLRWKALKIPETYMLPKSTVLWPLDTQ